MFKQILKFLMILNCITFILNAETVAVTTKVICHEGWFHTKTLDDQTFFDIHFIKYQCVANSAAVAAALPVAKTCLTDANTAWDFALSYDGTTSPTFVENSGVDGNAGIKLNILATNTLANLQTGDIKDRFNYTAMNFNGSHRKSWVIFKIDFTACAAGSTGNTFLPMTGYLKFFGSNQHAIEFVGKLAGTGNLNKPYIFYNNATGEVTSPKTAVFRTTATATEYHHAFLCSVTNGGNGC